MAALPPLTATRVRVPSDVQVNYIGRFAVRGTEVYAVGGAYGTPMLLRSSDGGQSFESWKTPQTSGLRDMYLDGSKTWVVGEAGMVAHTVDGGESWEQVAIERTNCIYSI